MKLIHRYIFLSVLGAASMAVGVCAFVLVAGNAIRDVIGLLAGGRLTFGFFFQLLVMLIPYVVSYALPLGMLIGILAVFGRLSAQNEITAMKASGFSLSSISKPIFLLAILGTLLAALINFYYAPIAKTAYKQGIIRVLREQPLQFIQPKVFIKEFPGYVLYANERQGGHLKDFWIWELNEKGQAMLFLKAREGYVHFDEALDSLVLLLKDGMGERRRQSDPEAMQDNNVPTLYFAELSIKLPLDKIFGENTYRKKMSMLTLDELLKERKELLLREKQGDPSAFNQRIKIQVQIQKNFAMAFCILALATVAIPLGIKANRSETYANSAIALGLAMIYYFAVVVVSWLEKRPTWRPDLLVWLPAIVFQIIGIFLFRRANRH